MKNLKLMMGGIGLIFLIACNSKGDEHRVITDKEDGIDLTIEYQGQVYFNKEGTDIIKISPNGYFKYKKGEGRFWGKNDGKGGILYEVNDEGLHKDLNPDEKKYLRLIVEDMVKHGRNAEGK